MPDITAQVLRELTILRGTSVALADAAERLTYLLSGGDGGTQIMAAGNGACQHSPNQREDLTTMGQEAGSHWACRACGHEYREEAVRA